MQLRELKGNSTFVSKSNTDICTYRGLVYWSGLHNKSQAFCTHSTTLVYTAARSSVINLTGRGNRAALFCPKSKIQHNYSLRRRRKASLRADLPRRSRTIASWRLISLIWPENICYHSSSAKERTAQTQCGSDSKPAQPTTVEHSELKIKYIIGTSPGLGIRTRCPLVIPDQDEQHRAEDSELPLGPTDRSGGH